MKIYKMPKNGPNFNMLGFAGFQEKSSLMLIFEDFCNFAIFFFKYCKNYG